MSESKGRQEGQAATKQRPRTKKPRMWRVLLHNDDYTTMDFVIHVLVTSFQKSNAEATYIMLQVHRKGVGVAGRYSRDVAETKVVEVTQEARAKGMPLKLTAEPEP